MRKLRSCNHVSLKGRKKREEGGFFQNAPASFSWNLNGNSPFHQKKKKRKKGEKSHISEHGQRARGKGKERKSLQFLSYQALWYRRKGEKKKRGGRKKRKSPLTLSANINHFEEGKKGKGEGDTRMAWFFSSHNSRKSVRGQK